MEIFKYLNQKMEIVSNNLIEQNDFISDEIGDDYSRDYEDVLENLENEAAFDLFNESHEEEKVERQVTEAEKINDSFNSYFGLGEAHRSAKKRAQIQRDDYIAKKTRRESVQQSNHSGLDRFLGVGSDRSHHGNNRRSNVSPNDMKNAIENVNKQMVQSHKNIGHLTSNNSYLH